GGGPRDNPPIAASRMPDSGRHALACRPDSPGKNSWHFALPAAGKHNAPLIYVSWIEVVFAGKGGDQPIIGGHVIEHAGEKSRLTGCGANRGWSYARYGKGAPTPFAVVGDARKGRH